MKKFLLLLISGLLLAGCASQRSNNLKTVSFEPEMEPLPIAAELRVLDQKVTGVDSGKVSERASLEKEALAKALGQNPPSVDKPDVLVGMNVFTEVEGSDLKVTVTGYPAYYTNFRTAKEEDFRRLNIAKLDSKTPVLASAMPEALPKVSIPPSKFGVRAGLNMNSFSSGNSNFDEDVEMGFGWSVGLAVNTPIISILSFNPELNFHYRGLYDYSGNYDQSLGEVALSVPLMLRVMPVESVPVYASAGVQFDVPFLSELETEQNGISDTKDFDDRAWFDIGIALGVGYHITENLVADFRFVIGLTSISDNSGDDSSLNQIGLGVSYFF